MVRLLRFVAMGTLAKRGLRKMIMCPARAGPPLGMSSFGIWHRATPYFLSLVLSFGRNQHQKNTHKPTGN
jgi:hypothetical protein